SFYPHIFLFLVAFVAIVAYLAPGLARAFLLGYKQQFAERWKDPFLLQRAELFVQLPRLSDARKEFGFWHNLRSAVDAPLRLPHLLVFPVAVAVLLFPSAYLNFVAVATGLFAWSVLALAGTHPRLSNVLNWLQRLFFHGGLTVV